MMRPMLLVSDVDGTIVKHDRTLAPSTISAAARLRAAGIRLALVSSRPPAGLDGLRIPLALDTPSAGFNGGLIQDPDGRVIVEHTISGDASRSAVSRLEEAGLDVWVFAGGEWLLKNEQGTYIAREQLSICMNWRVVPDFSPYLTRVHKIMGSSADYARCAAMAETMTAALGDTATVLRSQDYYVDITHPHANKGAAALTIARLLGVDATNMAAIGDMPNDLPMLRACGFGIAMGNSAAEVKAAAQLIVADNDHDGWSDAAERLLSLGAQTDL